MSIFESNFFAIGKRRGRTKVMPPLPATLIEKASSRSRHSTFVHILSDGFDNHNHFVASAICVDFRGFYNRAIVKFRLILETLRACARPRSRLCTW